MTAGDSPKTIEDLMFEVQETTITLRNEQWTTVARGLKALDHPDARTILREMVMQLYHGTADPDGVSS